MFFASALNFDADACLGNGRGKSQRFFQYHLCFDVFQCYQSNTFIYHSNAKCTSEKS